MKSGSRIAMLFAATLVTLAGTADAQIYTAYLSAAQEVPTNVSTATGYSRLVINQAAGTLEFTVVFNGLSSAQIAAHIHAPAPVGSNVGVAINFGAVGGTSGTIFGTTTITPTQIAQVRAGLAYVNVHSANFPGGEIRGQLADARVVDYDGDGKTDHSVLRFSTTTPNPITYYNFNSTTGFQAANWGDANIDVPTPGDYDGDGRDDVAIYRAGATPGAPSLFFVLRSSDGAAEITQWGVHGDQAVNRDYDGDGKTDIAVFRRGAAEGSPAVWWIRQSSNGAVRIVHWGTTKTVVGGDVPVPDDYDGDGKVDVAIYRYGNLSPANTFIVQRSSDGGATYQQFGSFTTDYVVPGDFDGDGKGDYAVARRGASVSAPMLWFILQSSNDQVRIVYFGISADLPTPGDYDGDGKTDISVFRRGATAVSQSTFWALGSFTPGVLALPWGLGGDYPVAAALLNQPVPLVGPVPLLPDVPALDTISFVGDLDLFTFTLGATLTRVVLQATRTDGTIIPCVRLLTGPGGPPVPNAVACGSPAARLDLELSAGTYFVEVYASGNIATGTYSLLYQPLPLASAVPLVADVPKADTISPEGDLDLFTFTLGAPLTRVILQATHTGGQGFPCVQLRLLTGLSTPPVPNAVACGSPAARLDLELAAGTYFVDVYRAGNITTGTYTLLYQPLPLASAVPLVADVPEADTISPEGDLDLFTFTLGAPLTRVILQATHTGGQGFPCVQLRLLTGLSTPPVPNAVACGSPAARLDLELSAGTSFVDVYRAGNITTGTYTLLYQPLPLASAVPLVADVPEADTISPEGDLDLFTFTLGAPLTRVILQATHTSGQGFPCVQLRLLTGLSTPPVPNAVACGFPAAGLDLNLAAGTYFVDVYRAGNITTGSYTLLYQPIVVRSAVPLVADVAVRDSVSLTVWAERVALLEALSEGARQFVAVAVVADTEAPTPPCGACRQLLWEYCGDIPVTMANLTRVSATHQLGALLPRPFDGRPRRRVPHAPFRLSPAARSARSAAADRDAMSLPIASPAGPRGSTLPA